MEQYPEMLTTNEVAALFQRHPRTIGRWHKEGHLVAVRPTGGKYLFPSSQEAIARLIRDLQEAEEDTVDGS
jgi:excisionase family DNA binding protein